MSNLFQVFNPLKIFILITFIFFLLTHKRKDKLELRVLVILFLAVLHETITSFLLYNEKPLHLISSIYISINFLLWIELLIKTFNLKKMNFLLIAYFLFATINLLFFEGIDSFNFNSFLLGTIIYIGLFVYQNFEIIKTERLEIFNTKRYLYLTSPILLFIGLSLMFAFKTKSLNSIEIFDNVTLFILICYLVNFICYTIIILTTIFKKNNTV